MKVDPYESATFQQEMEATWQGLKPLYEQVFIYSMFYIVSTYMLLINLLMSSCTPMFVTS